MRRPVPDIITGDVVLFSGNQLSGSIIKWFTNDKWNHMGIGVWLDNGIITYNTGELCILEMSNQSRFDMMTELDTRGPSFTSINNLKGRRYNIIGIRRMKNEYRHTFINNLPIAYQQYSNLKFSDRITKFIQGWLGYDYDTNIYTDGVFCTEYGSMIYSHTLGIPINEIFDCKTLMNHTCIPLTYAQSKSSIFDNDVILHYCKNDYFINSTILLLVITLIIVLTVVVITILVDRAFVKTKGNVEEVNESGGL